MEKINLTQFKVRNLLLYILNKGKNAKKISCHIHFNNNFPSINQFRILRIQSSIARSATSCALYLFSSGLKLRYNCVSSA